MHRAGEWVVTKVVIYTAIHDRDVNADDAPSVDERSLQRIRQLLPSGNVVIPSFERLVGELADAEVFYGYHSADIFRNAPALRWIQFTAAGLDGLLLEELVSRDLVITNASGVHAPQVSEMAWALTLAIAR